LGKISRRKGGISICDENVDVNFGGNSTKTSQPIIVREQGVESRK
jgi:hypothetical protein